MVAFVIAVIIIVYKICEQASWDYCKADNVDWSRMSRESHKYTAKEQGRLYKSGYYNKK